MELQLRVLRRVIPLGLCLLAYACGEDALDKAGPDAQWMPVEAGADASLGSWDASAYPEVEGGLDADLQPTDAALDATLDATAPDTGADAAPVVPAGEVQTSGGMVQGKVVGNTRAYLGIPYAAAPVGELRFAPPTPAPPWQGTREATSYGPVCPQKGPLSAIVASLPQSEDCLSLNVFAPRQTVDSKLPVMVFIHGGSGVSGSGAEYDAHLLSEAGSLLVVTLNYRLAALASLTVPALDDVLDMPSGNLAIRDQQLALRWVRDNIAAFGGDPGNVTLFGESAGAITSCLHLFAKGSQSLFHKLIMESGGCVGSAVTPATRAQAEATSQDAVTKLCPQSGNVVSCLRALPVQSLVDYENTRGNVLEQLGALYVDGVLFEKHPAQLMHEGKYNHVPVVLGSTLKEAHFLGYAPFKKQWPLVKNVLELSIALSAMYPDSFLQILGHYGLPADDAAANELLLRVITDSWFRCPARALARELSKQGGNAYLYSFELSPAVHTMELDYVFGWPEAIWSENFTGAPVPPLPELVQGIQGYWTQFAKTGDPNGGGRLAWPKYQRAVDSHLVLNRTVSVASKLSEADCDFWDSILVEPLLK